MSVPHPWGRLSSVGLAAVALLASQAVALAALVWWYGMPFGRLPDLTGDGVAVTIIILVSTPIELVLLVLFAQRAGIDPADYMAWKKPRRGDLIVGIAVVLAFILLANAVSWLAGRGIITTFQTDIYTTAAAQGWLPLLWLAVVVVTPLGEESLFRGFLFRGFFRAPNEAWPAIAVTALLFAAMHVQYDWFVILQVFGFGLLLGWMRWVSGSTLLTMALHAVINCEGMIETMISLWH
jgi:membrane protease YdiL (CAAX protease family)